MLPAHLAENIRKQVLFYLQSTFNFRDRAVERAFERFLTDPELGLFKGPWVQLQRPFRPADVDETVPYQRPVFRWLDEPTQEYPSLPTFHCSECGESGWIGLHDPSSDSQIGAKGVEGFRLDADPAKIYRGWFGYKNVRSAQIVVLSPADPAGAAEEPRSAEGAADVSRPAQLEFAFQKWYLCPKSLVLRRQDGPCPLTNDPKRFRVQINRDTRTDPQRGAVGDQGCPHCGSKEGVFFIGSQSATLSSVAIDELFGSVLNSDPKLLAFTDSVQDASHRAGFFTARTYRFTFRTALQHVIDAAGSAGLRLVDVGSQLLDWWSVPRPGWQGQLREAMAALMPPDLQEYWEFRGYRDGDGGSQPPPKGLLSDIRRRLTWEATSEFGLMQTHGRTMEPAGSACLGWDPQRVDRTLAVLRERVAGIDRSLEDVPEDAFRLWVYGFLHRARIRGALDHAYLADFATKGFWGKYPFGRAIPGRETYPPSGHYRPHLMLTQFQRGHDHVLASARGSRPPWQLIWARRALNQPAVDESSLLDLIAALLTAGAESGLFRCLQQDGVKRFYAVAADAAILYGQRVHLVCSESERPLVRPPPEAALWEGAPSLEYYAERGVYQTANYTPRQQYYQQRYRKGALRRVVASEHTGLLATEERERLEGDFSRARHSDDPNILTCTSTLEMGIDIGDLSSTMLCSIPPNTASYLQRIGRAGRATGTALIVSVVNQRPHDLFFYGRPAEMLRGRVDPPGCWLDASAVLVRQYLAYGFDSATKSAVLTELPKTGRQLIEDLAKPEGHIPRLLDWLGENQHALRSRFLKRFQDRVQEDTRRRFLEETEWELLQNRVHQATGEFDRLLRDLENARKRLRDQREKLEGDEQDALREIEQELRPRLRG